MVTRKERREDRSVGRQGRGRLSYRLLEENGVAAKGIDPGSGVPRVAIAAQVIGAKRVDRDQDDVVPLRLAAGARGRERAQNAERGQEQRAVGHGQRAYLTRRKTRYLT